MIQGGLCYAELGCSYVSSGGDYTYLRVAFGDFLGFLRVWIEVVLSRPMIVVLSVLTASNYLVYWFYSTCTPPDALVKCLSSLLLLILGFINLISTVWTNRLHQICNYFKIGTKIIVCYLIRFIFFLFLFSIIIACYRCWYLSNDSWSNRKFC